MKYEEGCIVTDEDRITDIWKRYFQTLLRENSILMEEREQQERETRQERNNEVAISRRFNNWRVEEWKRYVIGGHQDIMGSQLKR